MRRADKASVRIVLNDEEYRAIRDKIPDPPRGGWDHLLYRLQRGLREEGGEKVCYFSPHDGVLVGDFGDRRRGGGGWQSRLRVIWPKVRQALRREGLPITRAEEEEARRRDDPQLGLF